MRAYRCGICGFFKYDTTKCNVWKPGNKQLKNIRLCTECKKVCMDHGWLVLNPVGGSLDINLPRRSGFSETL